MTDPSRLSVASVTGTFRSLASEEVAAKPGGNAASETGNGLPERKSEPAPDLAKLAQALNNSPTIGRNLRFKVDFSQGISVIQVLDRDTGEIIRQIPPEKITTILQAEGDLALRLYDEVV